MVVQGHRDLVAWKKGMQLVTDVYRVTRDFPREEIRPDEPTSTGCSVRA